EAIARNVAEIASLIGLLGVPFYRCRLDEIEKDVTTAPGGGSLPAAAVGYNLHLGPRLIMASGGR
ncbi:MAG TPA: hypothetical protein VHX68_00060, partial [Planctomycetaceae bacterium]|nr:hypothetical protein [Planctomycetaceae bacterium]